MDWPTILQTERLVLRPWQESDAQALFCYASDPIVGPRAGWPAHTSVEHSTQVIRDVLAVPQTFAITLRGVQNPNEPVGAIGLMIGAASNLAIGSDQAELGYWIGKPFWGMGYVPEAVREVLRYGFCDLGLEAIWASHTDDNDQSKRVQEKTGFTRQRTIRDRPRVLLGDCKTEHVNRITRDEWQTLQGTKPIDKALIREQQAEANTISSSIPRISYVRSGGQTGADRGALDAAREAGVPICGWCPLGGLAEDLPQAPGLLAQYPELREGESQGYVERTAWNVRDSHATLIIAPAGLEPCSGTQMTVRFAHDYGRPCLVIQSMEELGGVRTWLASLGRGITLNVAGPRESKTPGTYALTKKIVALLLA
ncbi:MAG: GNAT family N-acetyltransferase [Coriobacteriales bacterium]|nr:GNAT family N-acetyltransferase [Coriobacteriales bacterium]